MSVTTAEPDLKEHGGCSAPDGPPASQPALDRPVSAGPRLKFSTRSHRGNVGADKSSPHHYHHYHRPHTDPELQTGRSVQLQDASAGGPEEGCRALFIQQRDAGRFKGRRRGVAARGSQESQGGLRRKDSKKERERERSVKSVRSLGNVRRLPGQFWSPWRPLGPSANV